MAVKIDVPSDWHRQGQILRRAAEGDGSHVVGDPCIVWDDESGTWRMFLFFSPPGCGDSLCSNAKRAAGGDWSPPQGLRFVNPDNLHSERAHKPFVIQDPYRPNRAVKIDGRYCLLLVSWLDGRKVVQQAWSSSLSGPWDVDPATLIAPGEAGDFDAKHVDAVTGYYFADRSEFLYFYMGYPEQPQPRPISPLGSSQGAAVRRLGETVARKLGPTLAPCPAAGHWASGWVGGLQLLPGKTRRWTALLNASPTAPYAEDTNVFRQEPPPSLGGFAYTDDEWPVSGWRYASEPIARVENLPKEAIDSGEGYNFWRHNLLVLDDGSLAVYYNSGYYGREQLYMISAPAGGQ